jgi:hypothetical protein
MKIARATLVSLLIVAAAAGCSKRQILPVAIAGAGAALMTGGFVYRATLPEEDSAGVFGETSKQKAITSTLVFSGLALVLVGVILSVTTPLCESDTDCWGSDTCEPATSTCAASPPATEPDGPGAALGPRQPPPTIALAPIDPTRFTLRLGPAAQ